MSDILIKGMEMPEDGEPVTLTICADGLVFEEFKEPVDVFHAVPVPPHGRLIDADALNSDGFHAVFRYTGKMPYEYTAMRIDDAPTIIPAEEGE